MTDVATIEPRGDADGSCALPVFTFVLVKLASRCNINCTYCFNTRTYVPIRSFFQVSL